MELPTAFRRTVVATFGGTGAAWLEDLPALVSDLASEWDLSVGTAFALHINWVGAVTRSDGSAAVLKLGPPVPGHLVGEAAALTSWDGAGAVRLLRHDPARAALLLERADPGEPAATLAAEDDEAATRAIVSRFAQLHRPVAPAPGLPDLEVLGADFAGCLTVQDGGPGLPLDLVERAAAEFADLCATAPRRVVLHGDLHHDNVLTAAREPWLAIDPHGFFGDPGYDVGAMLVNPPALGIGDVLARLPRRIEQITEGTGLCPERVLRWAVVKSVLVDIWSPAADGWRGRGLAFARAAERLLHG